MGDILFVGLDMPDMTTESEQADSLALMEEMCPSTTATPSTNDDDNENSNNESVDEDETGNSDTTATQSTDDDGISNCGPIRLGWLAASLLLAVTAFTFE